MLQFLGSVGKNCRWSKLPIRYRGALILSIPAICTFTILVTWIWSREDAIAVHRQIDRSEMAIIETNNVLSLINSAETGIRGYVITRRPDFLESYQQATKEVPNSLTKLEDLHRDTSQQPDVAQITKLIRREMSLLAQTVAATNRTSPRSSQIDNLFSQSQTTLDAIKVNANTLRTEEWELLNTHRQKLFDVRKTTNILLWCVAIISLLGFLAALCLFDLLERELENRRMELQARAGELVSLNQTLVQINSTLAERNQELHDFSHIVSHDLKAPLRAISNLSLWIEEDLEGKLTPDTQKQMNLLRERVGRMENMIEGLLQYARAGRQISSEEKVDVRQLIEETVDLLAPPPEFKIAIEGEMPIIETQRLLLSQIFSNLISNSIKHHHNPSQGKIVISVLEREKFYEFAVSDNGPGIAAKAQAKIFDIFQTLGKQNDKRNTGIGLATVKKIVENQNGAIEVESELNRGTTFRFLWAK
ncbi:ATP-binding protein [Myxosarcina sp. GI1]|uniref:sensor histidine kinase n=1 Tax=Myxosarcina sp. GI1 TaxID=1541065 RepID=UPI00068C5052|nr:sensor histidine kinase [Myxosarcina sp. GI1]